MARILIVDDDRETCRFMTELLAQPDRAIESTQQVEHALDLAEGDAYDLVISDINLEAPRNGLDVLQAFRGASHPAQVVLISGFGTLETAVAAVRAGAFDYISKPFDIREVKATVERALAAHSAAATEPPVGQEVRPPGLLGRTAGMLTVYKQIAHAADSTAPVLILGESGTGKELVARAIHTHGRRRERPFVSVNCGAVAESLLESELFGHVRGAFTGAVADARGIFEQGDTGTVFLDELGDTSLGMQVKLLRVLEEGEIRPVGGHRLRHVDVRVVAATHVDLERAVAEERFRRDLYYRLSVIVIRVPPLRERKDDVALLTAHFLQRASKRAGRTVSLSPAALAAITAHDWPGNVRELENTIERMVCSEPSSISRRSTRWSGAICSTCSRRSAATGRVRPPCSASIDARSIAWRSALASRSRRIATAVVARKATSPHERPRRSRARPGSFGRRRGLRRAASCDARPGARGASLDLERHAARESDGAAPCRAFDTARNRRAGALRER
jgi:DNA-binding NtrC family response regulator